MNAKNVLARLTATREDGSKFIVEVPADATFHNFYRFYTQQGLKRSTKKFLRSASRNEGMHPTNQHRQIPGLELVALVLIRNRFGSPVKNTRIRYISKKAYKKLIHCAPDQLGLTKVNVLFDNKPLPAPAWFSTKIVSNRNHHKLHAGSSR